MEGIYVNRKKNSLILFNRDKYKRIKFSYNYLIITTLPTLLKNPF